MKFSRLQHLYILTVECRLSNSRIYTFELISTITTVFLNK